MFSYTVAAVFGDVQLAESWISWLRDEHLAEVCAAGALDAEIVRCDAPGANWRRCEVRYHFESRDAFDAYLRNHAPRLRDEGLKRFPAERGIAYERTTGEVVAVYTRGD